MTLPSGASGVAAGDLLLARVVDDQTRSGPAEWSWLREDSNNKARSALWQRMATASDAGKIYTWPNDKGDRGTMGVLVIRGARGMIPTADAFGQNNGKAWESEAPSRNVTVANSLLITMHSAKMKDGFSSPPGMTKRYDVPGVGDLSVAGFTQPIGATGARVSALGANSENLGQSVIVAPAATPQVKVTWSLFQPCQ